MRSSDLQRFIDSVPCSGWQLKAQNPCLVWGILCSAAAGDGCPAAAAQVCTIFKVPIALVSLVEKERQWFKSVVGLQVPSAPPARYPVLAVPPDETNHSSAVAVNFVRSAQPACCHMSLLTLPLSHAQRCGLSGSSNSSGGGSVTASDGGPRPELLQKGTLSNQCAACFWLR